MLVCSKTLATLAVMAAAATGSLDLAQAQPIPQTAAESALPGDIVPGSPLADVVKMFQAGVAASTIQSYILNSPGAFNLDVDKILYLKDMGAPSDLINAMLERDKALVAANAAPPPLPAPAPTPMAEAPAPDTTDLAPPATEVTPAYFNTALTPYGSWVDVEGYGQCWRPTAVMYDAGWSPYCDRGHWVNTDYGWYWNSDYAWGMTFHYGRWFRSPRLGWCWYPDTVWAPSWVAWRSGGDYCGWAPLPPFAVYRPGAGFFYRGAHVGLDFDFGLGPDYFVFVSPDHFCDRHPRTFCVDRTRVTQVYHQTTIINNFEVHDHGIVNRGFGVERIASATHRPVQTVHVGDLPDAGRQGWRGAGYERTLHPATAGSSHNPGHNYTPAATPVANNQLRHAPEPNNQPGGYAIPPRRENGVQPVPGTQAGGHVPPQNYVAGQPTQPARPNNFAEPNHAVPPRQIPQNQPPQWQQPRAGAAAGNPGLPPRVEPQPAPRQYTPPAPPRGEVRPTTGEAPTRGYNPPPTPPTPAPAPNQPQPHNSGGGNGGGNNGNYNNNNNNKQNH